MVFFDVGQGDSIFIKTKDKKIVIDGGPDNSLIGQIGAYMPYWEHNIDYLVISHPHDDHFMGFIELIKRYDVGALIFNGVEVSNPVYNLLLSEAKEKNIELICVTEPFELEIGKGIVLDVLYPDFPLADNHHENLNEDSIIIKLKYESFSVLLTGDAEIEEEIYLMEKGIDLHADILKAPHHGSKTSSSLLFLEQVDPSFAVIQVGEYNKYGHPAYRTLRNYEDLGIRYFRTDQNGFIRIKVDG